MKLSPQVKILREIATAYQKLDVKREAMVLVLSNMATKAGVSADELIALLEKAEQAILAEDANMTITRNPQ